MRVWEILPAELCNRHLVAEHAEAHAVWSVIVNARRGYSAHPEVQRWRGRLGALARRHDAVAAEMLSRGLRHASPLALAGAVAGADGAPPLLTPLAEQRRLLQAKACPCLRLAAPGGGLSPRPPALEQ